MRSKKMEPKMEAIYKKYDDDKEAAIFYALSLFATADSKDKTYATQKKAGAILESIFPDQPDHPGIAHYIIHHYIIKLQAAMNKNRLMNYGSLLQ